MKRKTSITLIRPPYVVPLNSVFGNRGVPPLGMAYLAGKLTSENFEVKCIDSFAEDMDNFSPIDDSEFLANGISNLKTCSLIPKDTNIIGISCMFSNEWLNTSLLVREIKKQFPDVFLILGGEHVTADYKHILKTYSEVDAVILGEGEIKLSNLANTIDNGDDPFTAQGITYLNKNGDVVTNQTDYRHKNIDDIPNPNWSLIPLEKFHERGLGMSILGKRTIPMIISRGCPYQCTFCSSNQMWTTRWIPRSVDSVIEEIKYYIKTYDVNHLDFFDLTAIVNKKWTIEFCQKFIKENLKITWSLPSGTRSEALDHEVLTLLKESGCTKITYAPETGSKDLSKKIKKRVNLKKMLSSMRTAVKLGFVVKANIIFGFPNETLKDVFWNFVYIFKLAFVGIHDVPCFGFTPYPGTELFDELVKKGKVKRDENYDLFLANLVYTKIFNSNSWNDKYPGFLIPFLSLGGMSFFYTFQYLFRPWRLFQLCKNVYLDKPQTMLEAAFTNLIKDFIHGLRLKKVNKTLNNSAKQAN